MKAPKPHDLMQYEADRSMTKKQHERKSVSAQQTHKNWLCFPALGTSAAHEMNRHHCSKTIASFTVTFTCFFAQSSTPGSNLCSVTHPTMATNATRYLFLQSQPPPASLAALPASPKTAVLPAGPLLRAATSGEHATFEPPSAVLCIICPVAGSTLFFFIHSQFSISSSNHSARNLTPPSPAFTAPTPLTVA